MATKSIITRIKNKVDTLSAWQSYTGTLLDGEIAVVRVPTGGTYINPVTGKSEPVVELLMKVGDGSTSFTNLPWMSAKASDVYDWAKAATVEFNGTDNKIYFKTAGGSTITSVDLSSINSKITALETNKLSDITVSQSGSGVVKSVEKDGTGKVKVTRSTVATSEIADSAIIAAKIANSNVTTAKVADGAITNAKLGTDISSDKINVGSGTTDGTLSKKLSTMDAAIAANTNKLTGHTDAAINTLIDNKINALDVSDSGSGYVTKVTQTDGKISVTKSSLPTASTSTAGITKLGATGGAALHDDFVTLKDTTVPAVAARVTAVESTLDGVEKVTTSITNAINNLDVSEPTASGTSTSFIATAKQTDGKIVVTKANLPTASTSTAGIVKLGATGGAATYDAVSTLTTQVETNKGDIANLKTAVAGGVHFRGTVSSEPSSSTTVVNGTTIAVGDVVIYDGKEYICTAVTSGAPSWEQLGDVTRIGNIETKINNLDYTGGSFGTSKFATKVTQTDGKIAVTYAQPASTDVTHDSTTVGATLGDHASRVTAVETKLDGVTKVTTSISDAINALDVSEPSASGTSTSFIATAKQTDGKIVVTKKNLPTASTSVAGIVKLGATGGAATYDRAEEISTGLNGVDSRVTAVETKLDGVTKVTTSISNAIGALDFSDPTASSTTSTTFIDTISQTDGKITATKKTLPSASTSAKGIVQLNNTTTSTSTSQAATANAVKSAYDLASGADTKVTNVQSDYVRFNTTDNRLYIGALGEDEIIFDCGGAYDSSAASYSMRAVTPMVSEGSDGIFEVMGESSDITDVTINGESVNYTV